MHMQVDTVEALELQPQTQGQTGDNCAGTVLYCTRAQQTQVDFLCELLESVQYDKRGTIPEAFLIKDFEQQTRCRNCCKK